MRPYPFISRWLRGSAIRARAALLVLPWLISACASSTAIENTPVAPEPSSPVIQESPKPSAGRDLAGRVLQSVFTLKAFDAEGEQIGLGSGFAIPGNRLVTNAHVVADAAWIEILDQQGRMVSTAPYATLLDLDSDLAVLPLPGEGFAVIGLADDAASTGDDVWAFGAPLGLEGTVSRGIVSARRDRDGKSFLQITAPISQGSSGGPVVNDSGEIVGVVVAMMSEGQNLNFAVDVSELRQLLSVPAARLRFPSSQSLVRKDEELDDDVKVAFARLMLFATANEISSGDLIPAALDKEQDLEIDGNPMHLYRFSGYAGERVSIDVMSNEVDPFVVVVDYAGPDMEPTWREQDDDSGSDLDARLSVVLPESGDYMIYVSSREGGEGDYLISMNRRLNGFRQSYTSRWVLGSSTNSTLFFIDTETIQRASYGDSYLWILQVDSELEQGSTDTGEHHRIQYAFRCNERKYALRHVSSYSDSAVTESQTVPDLRLSWELIMPGTAVEQVSKFVCR